jgi:tetratricopeptide (TPR) repeat protein
MKWHSWILGLIIATGTTAFYPKAGMAQATPNSEARRLWSEGRDLYDEGNFADAEKRFREALTKYPRVEQSDRTTYYLIITLEKLRRFQEARTEIENFNRNFPGSRWRSDVDERSMALGVTANNLQAQEAKIAKERAESEKRGSSALPPNASVDAMFLGMTIQDNPTEGFERVKERLRKDPADPAAIANIGTIFNSRSPQALPFLFELANSAASPNVRTIAFFYAMRRNPDRVQVANTLMEMLEKKENEGIVSEALFRMTYVEHREVLAKIVESPNPNKFDAIEKIYRGGSITLRSDLLTAVAKLRDDPRAESFIQDAAQNDKDLAVRRAAVEALMSQKSPASLRALESALKATSPRSATLPAVAPPHAVAPAASVPAR